MKKNSMTLQKVTEIEVRSMTLLAETDERNFLGGGEFGCFHTLDCCFDNGS